jgi:hypothetical protein
LSIYILQQAAITKETFRTCQMYLIACIDRSLSGNNSIIGTQLMDSHSSNGHAWKEEKAKI